MLTHLRYATALAAAALVAAAAAELTFGGFLVPAFLVALVHAMAFGFPVALFAQGRGWDRAVFAPLFGFAVGAVPFSLVFVLPVGLTAAVAELAALFSDGAAVDRAGSVDPLFPLRLAGLLGLFGAAGGLAAWVVWRLNTPMLVLSAGLVLAGTVFVLAIPTLTMDRTCHNLFRDGRSFIRAKQEAYIPLGPSDWPALMRIFRNFAGARDWSFRDSTVPPAFYMSVCSEAGTLISASSAEWYVPESGKVVYGVRIAAYQPQGGAGWKAPMKDMLLAVEARWPGGLRFEDENNQEIAPPAWLRRGEGATEKNEPAEPN